MVWVGRGDDAHPGTEPMKTTVKLIGLDDYKIGVGEDIIGAIILGNTSEESITVKMALMHNMGTHRRCSGLTMGTGYTKSLMGLSQRAEYLSALLNLETVLTEIPKFLMMIRDGWRIDNQTRLFSLAGMWYLVDVFLIMNEHALFFQSLGEIGRCLVVACHNKTFFDEISGYSTHTNATGSDEIDCFDILDIHFANLITSLAMILAESGRASFNTFSLSDFNLASSLTVLMASCNNVSGASASFT